MKSLAKETAIYGVSSILGRFLNWLLVPLYTFVLAQSSDYGIVTNLYAWTALLLVVLTYGMETAFFRFANKSEGAIGKVYGTVLTSVGITSILFALCCICFSEAISTALGYPQHADFITMLGIVVSMDAFGSIPFAYLRYKRRPIKFAALKLLMIFTNILFNLLFLVVCPWLMKIQPEWVEWFYNPSYGVGYVFVSNLISATIVTVALLPDILSVKYEFDKALLKQMLRYALPLLVLGIAGIMNQTADKIIFPFLFQDKLHAASELGIYGACFKIAMVMMMFTQAFRYAYEPFIFAKHKDKNSVGAYADAMKYFIIFSLLILLGIIFYLDLIKLTIGPNYWAGLRVVPIVLFSYLFQGVFFNLSLWYKLIDKTHYGAIFAIVGCIITIVLNIVLVPIFSYMGSAWASFFCYLTIMGISYFIGQKHFPVPYDFRSIGLYVGVSMLFLAIGYWLSPLLPTALRYIVNTAMLVGFVALILKRDLPLRSIPILNKMVK